MRIAEDVDTSFVNFKAVYDMVWQKLFGRLEISRKLSKLIKVCTDDPKCLDLIQAEIFEASNFKQVEEMEPVSCQCCAIKLWRKL